MGRLRDIVNDKADELFAKLSHAESAGNTARAEALRGSLAFWNEIDIALRDAAPEAVPVVLSPMFQAAPEMFAALRDVRAYLEATDQLIFNPTGGQLGRAVAKLEDAIAKAEGRA